MPRPRGHWAACCSRVSGSSPPRLPAARACRLALSRAAAIEHVPLPRWPRARPSPGTSYLDCTATSCHFPRAVLGVASPFRSAYSVHSVAEVGKQRSSDIWAINVILRDIKIPTQLTHQLLHSTPSPSHTVSGVCSKRTRWLNFHFQLFPCWADKPLQRNVTFSHFRHEEKDFSLLSFFLKFYFMSYIIEIHIHSTF